MSGMGKAFFLLLCAGAIAAVAMMSGKGAARKEVTGQRFDVPVNYLFDHPIWFLGPPEKDSFVFLFEPNPNPGQIPEHRVLVESLSRFCPGNASQMLRIACGSERPEVEEKPPYAKVQDKSAPYLSYWYSVKDRPPKDGVTEKRQIAYCQLFGLNAAKPEPSTECTTFWSYDGMMLQFSFDERELSKMPAMKAKAMALLNSWKVR